MEEEKYFEVVEEIEDEWQSGFVLRGSFSDRIQAEEFVRNSKNDRLVILERKEEFYSDYY